METHFSRHYRRLSTDNHSKPPARFCLSAPPTNSHARHECRREKRLRWTSIRTGHWTSAATTTVCDKFVSGRCSPVKNRCDDAAIEFTRRTCRIAGQQIDFREKDGNGKARGKNSRQKRNFGKNPRQTRTELALGLFHRPIAYAARMSVCHRSRHPAFLAQRNAGTELSSP